MSGRPQYICVYISRSFINEVNDETREEFVYGPNAVHVWKRSNLFGAWTCQDCKSTYNENTDTFTEGEMLKLAQLRHELNQ